LENDLLERKLGVEEPLEDRGRDDWTLGSGDTVVETDKVGVSTEDIEEALAANIKAAGGAREKYAETVQAIAEEPENWSSPAPVEKLTFWGWLKSLFI